MANIKPIQPKLRVDVLSADQVAEIRAATLHLLEMVGVHFPSENALSVFAEHGAQVDPKSQIVRYLQIWFWRRWTTHHAHTPFQDGLKELT